MANIKHHTLSPALTTDAYTIGDVLFVPTEVKGALHYVGGRGLIRGITVIDQDDQGLLFDLFFMDANVSLGAINDTPSISDANALKIRSFYRLATADFIDLGGVKVASKSDLAIPIIAVDGSSSIWVGAVTGGTPTHSVAGLHIYLYIEST
jgi:hypothetical protein